MKSKKIVGFAPTVLEINYLSKYFDSIFHIAVIQENKKAPKNTIEYSSEKIRFIPIKPFGGNNFFKKITIISSSISTLLIIKKYLKEIDVFQFRAPTSIGVFLIPYLGWISKKNGWFKYAGNWNQKKAPLSYRFQKSVLKVMNNYKVTINGKWENQPSHCLSFENPCISKENRIEGFKIIQNKVFKKPWNLCFAGELNDGKGVSLILKSLTNFSQKSRINIIHFAGDGEKKQQYVDFAKNLNLNIKFHGAIDRESLFNIFKSSHFLLLPSKSEGFPKVVAEAANFGCIPIVSSTSSIPHYIQNEKNGFLWRKNKTTFEELLKLILEKNNFNFESIKNEAYQLAENFNYSRYTNRIFNEILNKK